MKTHVEFRSDKFPLYDGEDELINPNIWGKRLTLYLQKQLGEEGIETEEPFTEDWGWCLPIKRLFRYGSAAGAIRYPNGYLCFVEPSTLGA